ncbi:MAG TPA: hypothetical protein DD658_03585 [Deltaproteobacteria bacterium]|nr:hypothetical protein [Deltaproteobacteria bacterium]
MESAGTISIKPVIRVSVAFLAASFLLLLNPVSASSESYTYQDLHPPGWKSSAALCVNDSGQVAGYGMTGDGERGFLRSSGTFQEILPPGADSARANWVNGRGDVAGTAYWNGVPHAFLLRGGAYLDPTPDWAYSEGIYLGEDGSVAGTGQLGAYISRGGETEILPGFSSVAGGNSSGQLIGRSGDSALLFLPGQGYLSVTPPGATASTPTGINESGHIAVVALKTGMERGYVKSGEFYIDMTPSGWSSSQATAINDLMAVAGYGNSPAGRRSFLRSGGATEEISFPGWGSTEAVSLNNAGQVAGSGTTAGGETHAFLAAPASPSGSGSPGTSGSPRAAGGCSLALRGGSPPPIGSQATSVALLLFPLLLLRTRRERTTGSAP